jgi:hypothetical protein
MFAPDLALAASCRASFGNVLHISLPPNSSGGTLNPNRQKIKVVIEALPGMSLARQLLHTRSDPKIVTRGD